jgi:hypothetical protein
MLFTIEVLRSGEGGSEDVLHRVKVDEISPKRAKTKADLLLTTWRGRGATSTRILNPRGEKLYEKS